LEAYVPSELKHPPTKLQCHNPEDIRFIELEVCAVESKHRTYNICFGRRKSQQTAIAVSIMSNKGPA
jgi:hypothetical protein